MESQDTVFADLVTRVRALGDPAAATLANDLHHSSGALPDLSRDGTLSDVDVSCTAADAQEVLEILQRAFHDSTVARVYMAEHDPDRDYAIVAIEGQYARPVHVYVSTSALVAVVHRAIAVELNARFSTLAAMAVALKRNVAGYGTERAWFAVLKLGDPDDTVTAPWFGAMADRERVMAAAEREAKWMDEYVNRLPRS